MKKMYGIDMEQTQYSKTADKIPAPDPTGESDECFVMVIMEIEQKIKERYV